MYIFDFYIIYYFSFEASHYISHVQNILYITQVHFKDSTK